jgi:hypothetical protein
MANIDAPFGLKPVQHISGAPWNGATRRCRIDSTANDLGIGDVVVWNGAGSTCYPEVQHVSAGDGNAIFGVIVSFEPNPANLEQLYIASADSGWANVCCDPSVVFEIQADNVVGAEDIGANAPLVYTHTIDTTTGLSQTEMDATTTTNGSDQLLIIGAPDRADNDTTLTHAVWLVMINCHSLKAVDANGDGANEGVKGV